MRNIRFQSPSFREAQNFMRDSFFETIDTSLENNLTDFLNYMFFYSNEPKMQFSNLSVKNLSKLPFNGINNEILHYGGDYIVTDSEDKDEADFIFHFILPGHNSQTVEVLKKDKYIIIKSKQKDENDKHSFYKSVPLKSLSLEVKDVIFKDGVLSISIKDEAKEPVEESLQITQQ
jgi:HSP20 family molecular chaperone IbpA